jgi:ribose transport system permease protein
MRHPKELSRAPYQVYSGAEKFATSLGMGAYREAENSSRRTMMKDPRSRENPSTADDDGSRNRIIDRRSFLASAGKVSLGLTATTGLVGAFRREALAKDAVTTMGFDHPYNFVTYVSDIQRWGTTYAQAHGLKALYTSDNGKLDAQIANLETWIAQGVPAICCFPIEPTAIERVAAKARSKGIVWVSYAAHLKNQDSSVVFGNTQSGQLLATAAANFINKVHGGKAEIIRLTLPDGGELGRERDKAVDETLAKLAPEAKVVASQKAIDAGTGLRIVASVLASHPNVKAVVGINDDGALGAYRAFLDRGHAPDDPEIFIGGQDGAQQALTLIKQGTMYRASSALAVRDLAAAVIQHPIDVANGGAKEDAQVPVRLLTHDDTALLDEYIAQLTPEK